jgi:hypothetical protein
MRFSKCITVLALLLFLGTSVFALSIDGDVNTDNTDGIPPASLLEQDYEIPAITEEYRDDVEALEPVYAVAGSDPYEAKTSISKWSALLHISLVLMNEDAPPEQPGYINVSGGVRLRAESNTDSEILGVLQEGAALTVTGIAGDEDDWYAVTYGSRDGYILGRFITIGVYEEPARTAGDSQSGYVNTSGGVRLRAESNTDSEILKTLSRGTALTVTGVEGDWAKVAYDGLEGYMLAEYVSLGVYVNTIEMVDWWKEGKSIMKPGTLGVMTDVATGISFNIRAMTSGNHADSEPLTADDAAKILSIRGGVYSYTARAAVLEVNGRKIAVSYNGIPHGMQTIKGNNFDGHFCIHFLNSRNHVRNAVDANHQNQIKIAYNSGM